MYILKHMDYFLNFLLQKMDITSFNFWGNINIRGMIWFVFFSSIVSLSSYPPLFIFAYSSSNAFIPFLSVGLCMCRLRVEESPIEDIYGTSRPTGWLLPRSAPWSPSRSSDFRGWPSSCFRPAWWGYRCYHRRLHYHYYRW